MRISILCYLILFLAPALRAQNDSIVEGIHEFPIVKGIHEFPLLPSGDTTNAWNPPVDALIADERQRISAYLDELANLTSLPPQLEAERTLLDFVLKDRLYHLDFGSHRFPLDAEGGVLSGIVYRINNTRVTDAADLDRYARLLGDLPDFLRTVRENMALGLAEKRTNPRLVVERVVQLLDRSLLQSGPESLYLQPLSPGTDAARITGIVDADVLPAVRELRHFLVSEYLPGLPAGIGISTIAGGKDYYRHLVRYFTTDEVTPEEVFATGKREVVRIRLEMDSVLRQTGFTGSFAEFLDFLRTDPRFYARTPAELLERGAWITKRMEAKMPAYFELLPRMPLTVSPVPAALAPNYTGGRYSPGSYADRRAGAFWINTYDLPSRPLYTLPALALHEGVPGHHTQMMLAAELEGRSDFRRSLYLSAFGEGWALYCEYLGREAGIYEDAYEEFGRLTYEMWRACRLVVDPGMHYFGWSRERAVAFMAEHTALSLHEVNTEIDRYIGWPGQAVSYKMGELKIRELRRRAETALGERFDLAAFHTMLLSEGTVTMGMLEAMTEAWIERQ